MELDGAALPEDEAEATLLGTPYVAELEDMLELPLTAAELSMVELMPGLVLRMEILKDDDI